MKTEEHQKEVDKLQDLEQQLIKLITDTNNSDLMDKFSEWQSQRIVCNEGFLKHIESAMPEDPPEGFINSEAKLVEIGFEHNARSTADFTEYQKIVNGVTWAYVTRTAGNDYLTKDGEFVCHVETWSLLNKALDEYKLRD